MRAKAECCEWTKQICAIKASFRPWPDQTISSFTPFISMLLKKEKNTLLI